MKMSVMHSIEALDETFNILYNNSNRITTTKENIIMATDRYTSPLSERYASKRNAVYFSQDKKFQTWEVMDRTCRDRKELGLNITDEQIEELKSTCRGY